MICNRFVGEQCHIVNPDKYIETAIMLLNSLNELERSKTAINVNIVNYHQFTKGFGKLCITKLVKLFEKNTIVLKLSKEGKLKAKGNLGHCELIKTYTFVW